MPGIAGIIRREPSEGIDADVKSMVDSMVHEKDYAHGTYSNAEMGIYLGWAGHSCSIAKCMPLITADRRRMLILIGEHFDHRVDGPASKNNGDRHGRDLLPLFEELGDSILKELNGWFCGVLIDLDSRRTTLFNDRYGMGRVYVYEGQEEFVFASEAKAILRARPALRKIDPKGLAQYLRFNCTIGNSTLFKDISLLPAASSWSFDGARIQQKKTYFDFGEWEAQPVLDVEEFYQRFEETANRVFPSYMEAPQPVALSMTAGLDTRAILAACNGQKRILPCYTFGGMWGETFDISLGRKLATLCNQPFTAIKLNDEFLHSFPSLAQKSVYISDGTLDACGAHDIFFNEIARKIAPFRLTGKFGSEVVRIRRLIRPGEFPRHLLQPGFAEKLEQVPTFEQVGSKTHPLTRVVSQEIPWYEYGRVAVEQSAVVLRTPYMDNRIVELMYRAPIEVRASRRLQAEYVVQQQGGKLASLPTNMDVIRSGNQLLSRLTYLPFWALFKAEFTYLYAAPHWFTRFDRKFERLHLEKILAGRQKYEGYRIWFKTHFADFIQDTLLNPSARFVEFFDKAASQRVVMRHAAGTGNYLNEVNKMLTIELIHSTLLASRL